MGFKRLLRRAFGRASLPKASPAPRKGPAQQSFIRIASRPDEQHLKVGQSPVHIGRHSYISKAQVRQWSEGAALHIGAFCSLSDGITILLGGNHTTQWVTTFPLPIAFPHVPRGPIGLSKGDVRIGHDVWVGHGATILSGVTIGHGAVIGTKAVVAKDVAPYAIVVGNPAREIRKRFPDPIIALLLKLAWWDLPDDEIATLLHDLMAEPGEARLQALIAQYRTTS